MSWKYKKVEIELDTESGNFYAYVPDGDSEYNERIKAESLSALKKRIDAIYKAKIKKGVKLFVSEGWRNNLEINEVEITSVATGEHSHNREFWVKDIKTGSRSKQGRNELLRHDPKKVKVVLELNKKADKLKKESDKLIEELKIDSDEIFVLLGLKPKEKAIDEKESKLI